MSTPTARFSNAGDYATVNDETQEDVESLWFDSNLGSLIEPVKLATVSASGVSPPIGDNPNNGIAFPKCLSQKAFDIVSGPFSNFGEFRVASLNGDRFFLFLA